MNIPQNITKIITSDIAKLCCQSNSAHTLHDSKKISDNQFETNKYIICLKAGHIKEVVDVLISQGVEFDASIIEQLDTLFEQLAESVDIKKVDIISQKTVNDVNAFASKYQEIVPNDDFETSVKTL